MKPVKDIARAVILALAFGGLRFPASRRKYAQDATFKAMQMDAAEQKRARKNARRLRNGGFNTDARLA